MASGGGNASWTQLRQQSRSLESQTEQQLQTYSQLSSASTVPPKPTEQERQTEKKLEEVLGKRDTIIRQLTRLLDSDPTLTSSAVKQNNLALLREKYEEHRRDVARLKARLAHSRDRANLLARSDVASSSANSAEGATEADYMLDERGRLDNSHNMVDSVLSQAYAVNENFISQNETINNINRRITLAASQVPGLNALIGRISNKKRRDGIIMGSFIAFCFLIFFWVL